MINREGDMAKISGGCLCGNVHYSSDAEPVMVVACHCAHCQKQSGSAFSMNLGIPTDQLSVTGESLATYGDQGSSGMPVLRKFCRNCGSQLFAEAKAFPGVLFVKAGSLDDASWVAPTAQIWCASRQPWATLANDLPQIPGNPSGG